MCIVFFSEQRLEQCIMGRMLMFSGAALVILDDVAPKNYIPNTAFIQTQEML